MTEAERTVRLALIDQVQLYRLRYEDIRQKFITKAATVWELHEMCDKLLEAEAALKAHEDLFGKTE